MKKLTMRMPFILIGLNIFLLSGCVLFEMDPPVKKYLERYKNLSSEKVTIVMKNINSSEIIEKVTINKGKESTLHVDSFIYGGDTPVKGYVDDLIIGKINKIELYVNNILKKEWTTPHGYLGKNINNPFNYDSWYIESIEPYGNNIVGKITFTITDSDLVVEEEE